jgi:Zn-dependent M28 family amino/carboxypeptidase
MGEAHPLLRGRSLAGFRGSFGDEPRRSILFVSVTGEEKGLLGSQYYAEHPLYPLAETLADINMDGLNMLGRTRDIDVIGLGQSTLDDVVEAVAAEQGRVVRPDAQPEKGFYFRSDHFNFAKQGVPALDPDPGVDYIGKPEGWGLQMRDKYTSEDYHKPSNKIKPDWDLSGTVEDLALLGEVGTGSPMPEFFRFGNQVQNSRRKDRRQKAGVRSKEETGERS